jgi:uncharacterized membrane-anchored protein
MKRGQIAVQEIQTEFKIHTELDVEDSLFITGILLEYVSDGKITFELNARKGSIISEFLVNVIGGLFSAVLYDLTKKIYNRLKEEKQKGKAIKPVHIFLRDKQYILTGDELDSLPKD